MDLRKHNALILDLGDVLFTWSANPKTAVSPAILRTIINCPIWSEYECGRLSEAECYKEVASYFSLTTSGIRQSLDSARCSLQPNQELIAEVCSLKLAANGALRVFAFSNISAPDWDILSKITFNWEAFDATFTSHALGLRKPDLRSYRRILESANIDPTTAIFVDDKLENVVNARAFGMTGVRFDNNENVIRTLRNLLGDPVKRGREFLERNAGRLDSLSETGVTIRDNFAQLLILDATGDRELIYLEEPIGKSLETWNYFVGKPILTTAAFPDDVDTTAIALQVLYKPKEVVMPVLDEMLKYTNTDGIIQVYFDQTRPRVEPTVCCNVLRLFYRHNRGHEVRATLQWIETVLLHREYLGGTRHYPSPECFLYFLTCFVMEHGHVDGIGERMREPLRERLSERVNMPGCPFTVAIRVLACQAMGIDASVDVNRLLGLQDLDGGWRGGWLCQYGSSGMRIENPGLTTALIVNAIEAAIGESDYS